MAAVTKELLKVAIVVGGTMGMTYARNLAKLKGVRPAGVCEAVRRTERHSLFPLARGASALVRRRRRHLLGEPPVIMS